MTAVQPQRMKAEKARRERQVIREAQKAEFQRQRQEAIEAEKQRRTDAMHAAAQGDQSAPVWAQVRQCYVEHRPAQIMHERQMRRCHGGSVLPIHHGRRTCLPKEAVDLVVGAA